jgi:hypothetical protein
VQASVVAERVWLSGQQLAVTLAWQLAPPASAGAEDIVAVFFAPAGHGAGADGPARQLAWAYTSAFGLVRPAHGQRWPTHPPTRPPARPPTHPPTHPPARPPTHPPVHGSAHPCLQPSITPARTPPNRPAHPPSHPIHPLHPLHPLAHHSAHPLPPPASLQSGPARKTRPGIAGPRVP